jgi:hypothetical protein
MTSWTGGHQKAIEDAEMALEAARTTATLVSAASAYYGACGAAFAELKRRLWKLRLVPKLMAWRRKALRSAAEARTMATDLDSQVRYQITADQVDVLCSVWFHFGGARQTDWARELLKHVAEHVDARKIEPHTLAFIALHRVRFGLDVWSEAVHDRVLRSAQQVAKQARAQPEGRQAELGQASRIMRQLAGMLPASDRRVELHRSMAEQYAKEAGATDQLLKLGR